MREPGLRARVLILGSGGREPLGHGIRAVVVQHASPPVAGTALSDVTPQG